MVVEKRELLEAVYLFSHGQGCMEQISTLCNGDLIHAELDTEQTLLNSARKRIGEKPSITLKASLAPSCEEGALVTKSDCAVVDIRNQAAILPANVLPPNICCFTALDSLPPYIGTLSCAGESFR